ncbi:putative quinol monooxygenase [Roseibium porphyridii]|uniref:Quinol monooxygenase n=1 Tax=Roseibium porphyridii TaxID=2866279 RepID=A0ABY8FD56_9HYPH|nr:putative quinol monooxygenase [Roseibium sp. KMA01]WFE92132.1 putative quinol monooxygenase [Roseibium sp. KMA01]
MSNYFVSAGIELQEGADLKEAENGLRLLVEQTQSEPGCILFEIRQNLKQPQKFTLWECWTNRQALQDHFEMPHTKAYLARNLTEVNYIEELGEIGSNARPDTA